MVFLFWVYYRFLMELVERHGQQRWSLIATYLTGRIGKQCRERWHNHLRPDIKVCTMHTKLKSTCLKTKREREREGSACKSCKNSILPTGLQKTQMQMMMMIVVCSGMVGIWRKKRRLCLRITNLGIDGLTLPSSFRVALKTQSRITGMPR